MKSKASFLTIFIFSILISCNQKKEKPIEEEIQKISEIEINDESKKVSSNIEKSIYFTIDNKKYSSETNDETENDVLESKDGIFSIILGFSETNNDENWGTFNIKINEDLLTEGVKKVESAVLTLNYSGEESLPMVYSSSSEEFKFEVTKIHMEKSESMAGMTITDYKFSGVFSGNMKGVDSKGSIINIEVKDGEFQNFNFAQFKKN